ncbi:MAG: DUF1492 domain-containing protein [Oscillibacter sp.]|nr:DUF1492 domain-containing protein [Oscillibacter sp.]
MTNQEKKRWLRQYLEVLDDQDELIEERKRWKAIATKITAAPSGMPGGGSERGGENAMLQLAEISREIDAKAARARAVRTQIRACISRIPDARLRRLLRLRYISGLTFDEIAERMHYSWRWVIKLHGQALDQLRVEKDMEVHIDPW